jgi:undecaprenyl diphosphate synthase
MPSTDIDVLPKHLGFILDGNRRWARQHTLPTYEGHLAGYNALREVLFAGFDSGIAYISIYAFSTENWKRGEGEVGKLMKLAMRVFKHDLQLFIDRNIRVLVLGTADGIDEKLVQAARVAEERTAGFTGRTLCICFNYGGQREIADAAAQCVRDGLGAAEITEEAIAARLYHPEVPPIDIVVRTSGEERLSNFMLWRVAYSELLFIEKYWPDMREADISGIIEEYSTRQRRHGG